MVAMVLLVAAFAGGGSGAWPLVRIPDPVAAAAARAALDGAQRWAGEPRCETVVEEFGLPAPQGGLRGQLESIFFMDDSRDRACRTGIMAFTAPGTRVVHICAEELKKNWRERPDDTKAAFIHEALHTLGLGENPPSSREITKRVLARCAR